MPIRLGFIGYGIMGERLLRAALAHDPNVIAVAGVWDPSSGAMARLAGDLPDVAQRASAEALVEASDCVYIASPPASHLDHARRAFVDGRAVFCEKPLGIDLADSRRFVAEADAHGARSAVNFPFASSFAVDQLKAWMTDGTLGDIRSLRIEAAFAAWPRPFQADAAAWLDGRAEGGFTREVVSHFLFLARRLLGPLRLDRAAVEYLDAGRSEASVEAGLAAGSTPIVLTGAVGKGDQADHNLWILTGSAGSARIRDWAVAERFGASGWTEAPDARPNEEIRPLVLRRQLDKVAAMTRGEPHDLATVREALDVQEIVEAILHA